MHHSYETCIVTSPNILMKNQLDRKTRESIKECIFHAIVDYDPIFRTSDQQKTSKSIKRDIMDVSLLNKLNKVSTELDSTLEKYCDCPPVFNNIDHHEEIISVRHIDKNPQVEIRHKHDYHDYYDYYDDYYDPEDYDDYDYSYYDYDDYDYDYYDYDYYDYHRKYDSDYDNGSTNESDEDYENVPNNWWQACQEKPRLRFKKLCWIFKTCAFIGLPPHCRLNGFI